MLTKNDYEKLISFAVLIDKLKSIKRHNYKCTDEHENVAEHSWHIAAILLLFKDEFEDLNFEKMLTFAILHDIPEILGGDYCPFDTDNHKKMIENEDLISSQIYSILPKKISTRFKSLQKEFDKTSSKEAQVVKAIDRLQHLLQHLSTNKSSYKKWNVDSDAAKEYIGQSVKDEVSKKLLDLLLKKAIKKEVFPINKPL